MKKALGLLILLFSLQAFAGDPVSCGPAPASIKKVFATKVTLKAGVFSDPLVWGGAVPGPADDIDVAHNLVIDRDATVRNVFLRSADLMLDSSKTVRLKYRDIWATGASRVRAKPLNASIHSWYEQLPTIEQAFKGGGLDHLDTDPGIWIMDQSQLILEGAAKTSWLTLTQAMPAGATTFTAPVTGWLPQDQLAFAPSQRGSVDFSEVTWSGSGFTALPRAHPSNTNPMSGNTFYPEVMNLSRNVHVVGAPTGRGHIFVRSGKPQFIKYVEFRYLGPRTETSGDDRPEKTIGRYVLHLHHSMDGSRGSEIIGNVARDCGNHVYVAHMSNGVLFIGNIAYKTMEDPFWWDEGHISDDIVYDGNIVAGATYLHGSKSMNEANPGDPNKPPTLGINGFQLGMGKGLVAIKNVVVGLPMGDEHASGAYHWEANNETIPWLFRFNVAHNNFNNFRSWQNTPSHHLIEDFVAYNGHIINAQNGAYSNAYRFIRTEFFGGLVEAKAASSRYQFDITDDYGQIWENSFIEEILFLASPLASDIPILVRNSKIGKLTNAAGNSADGEVVHGVDVVNSQVGTIVMDPVASTNEFIRYQDAGLTQIWKLTKAGKVNIPRFNFDVPAPPTFTNAQRSQSFTRNNCPAGTTAGSFNYTVAAGKYSAPTQAEADQKALLDIQQNGQNQANMNATCQPQTVVFKSARKTGQFTRNNCPEGSIGSVYTYSVDAGQFESTVSQADADRKADDDVAARGQNQANLFGTCTPVAGPSVTVSTKGVLVTLLVNKIVVVSDKVQAYTITTTGNRLLKSGNLAIGENIIDFPTGTQASLLVKVAGKSYTVRR